MGRHAVQSVAPGSATPSKGEAPHSPLKECLAVPGVFGSHLPAPGAQVPHSGERVVEDRRLEADGSGLGTRFSARR